jgi:hypothetical protein
MHLMLKKHPPEGDGQNIKTCPARVKSIIIKLDRVHLVGSYFSF